MALVIRHGQAALPEHTFMLDFSLRPHRLRKQKQATEKKKKRNRRPVKGDGGMLGKQK